MTQALRVGVAVAPKKWAKHGFATCSPLSIIRKQSSAVEYVFYPSTKLQAACAPYAREHASAVGEASGRLLCGSECNTQDFRCFSDASSSVNDLDLAPKVSAHHPVGIEFVDLLNTGVALEDTDNFVKHILSLGLVAIIHKAVDLPPARAARVLAALRIIAKTPGAPLVIDGDARIDVLSDRWEMCAMLRELSVSGPVHLPHTTLAPDTLGHVFPAVLKPLSACGARHSHDMAVVFAPEHVGPVPGVLQAFVPHGSVLFKVYVVGDLVDVQLRPTVELADRVPTVLHVDTPFTFEACPTTRTLLSDPEGELDSAYEAVHAPQTLCFKTSEMKKTRAILRSSVEGLGAFARLAPHMDAVRGYSARLRVALGDMALFGWDLIIGDDGVLYAIDVNYFPGYDEAPFPAMLAAHLQRVLGF